MGGRVGKALIWNDYIQKTNATYNPERNMILRLDDSAYRETSDLFGALYRAFLSADVGRTIDAGHSKLVHQKETVGRRNGRRCVKHHFRLQGRMDQRSSELEWIVYVDPETRLPFRWEQVSRPEGGFLSMGSAHGYDVDYPDTGPASIYALGAPKTAKVVDRVMEAANPDADRLVAGVKAARLRADRYHVMTVESRDDQHWSQASTVYRAWRNGRRWRVERSFGKVTRLFDELAPEDADPATWWRKKAEKLRFVPAELCDGKWLWTYSVKSRSPTQADIDAGAPDERVLVSVVGKRRSMVRKDKLAYYHLLGWPRMDHCPRPLSQVTVDADPKSGPANTVLLQWRNATKEVILGTVIEGVTQCPQSQWYPTVVRRLNAINSNQDIIRRLYYDFDAPMPDSLFEPE